MPQDPPRGARPFTEKFHAPDLRSPASPPFIPDASAPSGTEEGNQAARVEFVRLIEGGDGTLTGSLFDRCDGVLSDNTQLPHGLSEKINSQCPGSVFNGATYADAATFVKENFRPE
jgi:hypothetical protein